MKGTRFEKDIDLKLYRQMVNMIYQLSSNSNKRDIKYWIEYNSLFWEEPDQSMEEAYDLHYPGEVLERLNEKTELSLPKVRALSLALGQTKELHEEGMFIGTQFTVFSQKVFKKEGKPDVYLLAAKYLLEEKDKKHAYDEFMRYSWKELKDILFALSVLPEDEYLWDKVKTRLNQCLGTERELDVYEDAEIYLWISKHCAAKFKGYRKKDIDTLKYIVRLFSEAARSGSTVQNKLLESGYSSPEIAFLSGYMIIESGCGILRDSITAERIAVEICEFFLNGEVVYPEHAYRLCEAFLDYYEKFTIKLEGTDGILEYLLPRIQLKNCRSYQCMYGYRKRIHKLHLYDSVFYIDLTDPRWDPLHAWIQKDEFDTYVTHTISEKSYTDEELRLYLLRYKEMTGNSYDFLLWERKRNVDRYGAFCRLSNAGFLDPVQLTKQYVQDLIENSKDAEEKWENMSSYLTEYMTGIDSPEAFQMLAYFMEKKDSLKSKAVMLQELLFDSFEIPGYGDADRRFEGLDFVRPFLTIKEHNQLFLWLEQVVFENLPDMYISFLRRILEDSNLCLWMPEEEERDICFRILPLIENLGIQKSLQKRYMTEEEYACLEQEEKEKRRRKQFLEKKKKERKMKRHFTKQIAKAGSDRQLLIVEDFCQKYRYPEGDKAKSIVAGYLSSFWKRGGTVTLTRKEAAKVMEFEVELYEEKMLEIDVLRSTILGLEEVKDA